MIRYNLITGLRKTGIIISVGACLTMTACGNSSNSTSTSNETKATSATTQATTVAESKSENNATTTQNDSENSTQKTTQEQKAQEQTTKEQTTTQKQTTTATTSAQKQASNSSEWKTTLIDYLNNESSSDNQGYNLIYVNDDNIPEILEIGNGEAMGCRLVVYNNGKANVTQFRRLGVSYIPKANLICNTGGHMDNYFDIVYSIQNGDLTLIADGAYGDTSLKPQLDEKGNIIYQYSWNGNSVSKEEYEQDLNSIYDTSKAVDGYDYNNIMSKQQVIDAINNM